MIELEDLYERTKSVDLEVDEAKKGRKHDPRAKVRNRGKCIFPAESPKVKDDKDHFPINDIDQARNALARVAQYDKAPDWYRGSLSQLQKKVRQTVKKEYPSIDVSEAKDTLRIVARGLADETDAQDIARKRGGRVIADPANEEKYAVVVEE